MKAERLVDGPVAVKRCLHGTMMYNPRDTFVGRSLDLYGEWCERELEVLGQVIEPGDTVLDVGANIGTHTIFFARAVGPSGHVIAFEPQRAAYHLLCGNVALNALHNVTCVRAAVSDERGDVAVPELDPSGEANFGAVAVGSGEDRVDAIPIDDLGLEACALVKVDVEGMEPRVLLGARETIARAKPALFVECNTQRGARDVMRAVRLIGYRAYWHIAPYFREQNHFENGENVFEAFQPEANLLCVPAETPLTGLLAAEGDEDWQAALLRAAAMAEKARG